MVCRELKLHVGYRNLKIKAVKEDENKVFELVHKASSEVCQVPKVPNCSTSEGTLLVEPASMYQ